jgi:hypothetical protein
VVLAGVMGCAEYINPSSSVGKALLHTTVLRCFLNMEKDENDVVSCKVCFSKGGFWSGVLSAVSTVCFDDEFRKTDWCGDQLHCFTLELMQLLFTLGNGWSLLMHWILKSRLHCRQSTSFHTCACALSKRREKMDTCSVLCVLSFVGKGMVWS